MAVFKYENKIEQERVATVSKRRQGDSSDVNAKIERIYDEHVDELYKYALMILVDHGEAENAVQQVFFKMMKIGNGILKIDSYGGYLRKAVRNECYEIIKKRNRYKGFLERLSTVPIIESSDEKEANEEERELLEDALKKLPPEQREVLHMKIFEERTFSEIAEIISLSVNTVASRYRYAMDKLKEMLSQDSNR